MKKSLLIPLLPALIALLVGCQNTSSSSISSLVSSSEKSEKIWDVSLSFNNEETINVYNEWQLKYITSDNYEDTGVASGTMDWSRPTPINITWQANGVDAQDIDGYELKIIEDNQVIKTLKIEKTQSSVSITNLKMRTNYVLELNALYKDEIVSSATKNIIINQSGPRLIDVEGVDNMRDLGGYGLKQGLIYRCGRLSEDDGEDKITAQGKKTMLEDLHIKSEIDLRRNDEFGDLTISPLGEGVNYLHLPMVYGGNNIATYKGTYQEIEYNNPARIKEFFTYLSNENNYPIIFHCSIGKDRTGCLAYLLEGLLGVCEENLYRDYLFSNFSEIGSVCKIKDITGNNRYGQTIRAYEGETLQEKITNFLTSEVVGLEKSVLDKVSNILKDNTYGRE